MINLVIDMYLPNSVTYSRRTWNQPINDIYLLNIAMKSSSCTSTHLNWRRNSKKQDDSVDLTLALLGSRFVLNWGNAQCILARWKRGSTTAQSIMVRWKRGSNHSAKHYGPLKARLKPMQNLKFSYLSFIYFNLWTAATLAPQQLSFIYFRLWTAATLAPQQRWNPFRRAVTSRDYRSPNRSWFMNLCECV